MNLPHSGTLRQGISQRGFLAYHGDRLVQPGISDMTVQQLARMIVHFKQDVIETLTDHAAKVFQAVLTSITTHTHEGTTGQTQKQQVPNNLTEMRDNTDYDRR